MTRMMVTDNVEWKTLVIAASLDLHGVFTPGARYERDDEGRCWRTRIGMQGEALSEREQCEEPS